MAETDATLSLDLNLKQAEDKLKQLPSMIEDALKKIEGKGLDELENELKTTKQLTESLCAEFKSASNALKEMSAESQAQLQALEQDEAAVTRELKAQESGLQRLKDAYAANWARKPDTAGAKNNLNEQASQVALIEQTRARLESITNEETRLKGEISSTNDKLSSMAQFYNEFATGTQELVSQTGTVATQNEQEQQAQATENRSKYYWSK